MEQIIKEILECQNRLWHLEHQIDNKEYWIKEAEKVGFEPDTEAWVHVEMTTGRIEISVYHKDNSRIRNSKHWINGIWCDTSFPKDYPSIFDLMKKFNIQ